MKAVGIPYFACLAFNLAHGSGVPLKRDGEINR